MNQFISPHQNININISYNVGQQKIPKIVFGKKFTKIIKSSSKNYKNYSDNLLQTFKKNYQLEIQQSSNKKDKFNKNHKTKKKCHNLITLSDQQIIIPKRLKTQGNTKPQLPNSLPKKQPKTTSKSFFSKPPPHHSKSLHNHHTLLQHSKILHIKKQSSNLTKFKKQQRKHCNKSCILYQPKKHIIFSDIQHVISSNTTGTTPASKCNLTKKRVNSTNMMKNNKFINRLLDMSVLTSQLGGSIPLKQQINTGNRQKINQNTNNRIKNSLQDCINSIDLRIIKKMQQDNQSNHKNKSILKDTNIGQGLQLIIYLNKIRRISLDKLNQSANKIQRFWKKKNKQTIIPFYTNLFFRNPTINSHASIQNYKQPQINPIVSNHITSNNDLRQIDHDHIQILHIEIPPSNHQYQLPKNQRNFQKNHIKQLQCIAKIPSPKKDIFSPKITDKQTLEVQQITNNNESNEISKEKPINNQVQISKTQKTPKQKTKIQLQQRSDQDDPKSPKYFQQQQQFPNTKSLNIQKYKQLVKQSIQKNKQSSLKSSKITSIPYKKPQKLLHQTQPQQLPIKLYDKTTTQIQHWNYVHNMLSFNMNLKQPSQRKNVLQQLIQQSAYNKLWVQGQFSNSQSKKISQKSSPRDKNSQSFSDKCKSFPSQSQKSNPHQQIYKNQQPIKQTNIKFYKNYSGQPSPHLNQRRLSQQDNCYNWKKYSDISRIKKSNQLPTNNHQKTNLTNQLLQSQDDSADFQYDEKSQPQPPKTNQIIMGLLPSHINSKNLFNQLQSDNQPQQFPQNQLKPHQKSHKQPTPIQPNLSSSSPHSSSKDQTWIRKQLATQTGIVQKYLDCGLDNFGLHLSNKSGWSQTPVDNFDTSQIKIDSSPNASQLQDKDSLSLKQSINIEQIQQHQPKLQKQHHFQHHHQQSLQKQISTLKPNQNLQSIYHQQLSIQNQHVDIFSNDENQHDHQQDKQLVYVFQNINSNKITQHQNNSNNNCYLIKQDQDNSVSLALQLPSNKQTNSLDQNQGNRLEDFNEFVQLDLIASNKNKSHQIQPENQPNGCITQTQQTPQQVLIPSKQFHSSLQQQSQKIPLFQPSYKPQPPFPTLSPPSHSPPLQQIDLSAQQQTIRQQLKTKRIQKITQIIIAKLIQQFAHDVSIILRKSQIQTHKSSDHSNKSQQLYHHNFNKITSNYLPPINNNNNQPPINPNNNLIYIHTNFQNIREFISKLKQFILSNEKYCLKVIQNLKNNIGPTSLQILGYLRVEQPPQFPQNQTNNQPQPQQQQSNQQWLFVIPNDLFQLFNKKLLLQQQVTRNKKMSNRFKLYMQFWHRSIFQCYNQCLDCQRPFGITGAPYAWIIQPKIAHQIKYSKDKVQQILQNAQIRILQLACSSAGIIFDKAQSPYNQYDLSQQQKIQLNEQKISGMLATEILDDQYTWITYNDQITQLLVDITRKIQELLIFQISTDLKKIMRRRKMIVHASKAIRRGQYYRDGDQRTIQPDQASDQDQHVTFLIQDLI